MKTGKGFSGRWIIWIAAILLVILHQDLWFWHNSEWLVWGFMPIGLAYHAGFSIAAALLWAAANRLAWPDELEAAVEAAEKEKGDSR